MSTALNSSTTVDGNSTKDIMSIALAYKNTNGPMLIAVNMTWLLYGCYLVQTYHFFQNAHTSRNYVLRILVIIATLTETLHLSFATVTQWATLVEHWGDPGVWRKVPWTSAFLPFTSALNGFIVQLFFLSRILLLSNHVAAKVSAYAIAATSISALSGSIGMMILFIVKLDPHIFQDAKLRVLMRLWSVSTVACDIMIASTMSLVLFSARSRTTYKSMRNLLANLVLQSIETGTVTAVTMSLFLICWETKQHNGVFMVWEFASGPIYGNVLLFVLNSRQSNAHHETVLFTSPSSILKSMDLMSTGWTKSGSSI